MNKPEVERQKSPNLGFWGRIGLESLWIFCKFFSILPYWFRYYVVEPVVFGALRLLRYRYRVVTENLRNSFPEKSPEELRAIRRGFYRTLAEIFVDTFSLAGLTDEKCRQVVVVKDLEKQMAAVEGRDWIALTAHLGCWEYCSFWGIIVPSQVVVAVYHPLRSRVFDELYKRLRSHANICPVPMAESLRFYLRNREKGIDGKNIVMGLIADQNPPRRKESPPPSRQPLVPLPQSGYDLFRRRGEAGAALRPARILLLAAACQTGLLRDGFRPDLRRRRGGRSP